MNKNKYGKKNPIIELRGVEFVNKGAELMLYAIVDQVKQRWPESILVMEHTLRAPRSKQLQLGIFTKTKIRKHGYNIEPVLNNVPRSIRKRFHFIKENEIDLVLDGSGFAFGDFWGAKKAGNRLADHIKRWRKQGTRVVLLPQAMGPFTDERLQEKMKVILNNADLIFVRDKYSLNYIRGVNEEQGNIYLRPDFTNVFEGKKPDYIDTVKNKIAIIPNSKIIQSKTLDEEAYMAFLNQVIEGIEEAGEYPFFLIHAGEEDVLLAKAFNQIYAKEIKIVNEENPVYIKGIIGCSKGVITSRFHGLVSALSQAIPCLAFGWSHKYKALLEDYNYTEGLISKQNSNSAQLSVIVNNFLDKNNRESIHDRLLLEAEKQKLLTSQMWDMIDNLLKN